MERAQTQMASQDGKEFGTQIIGEMAKGPRESFISEAEELSTVP